MGTDAQAAVLSGGCPGVSLRGWKQNECILEEGEVVSHGYRREEHYMPREQQMQGFYRKNMPSMLGKKRCSEVEQTRKR